MTLRRLALVAGAAAALFAGACAPAPTAAGAATLIRVQQSGYAVGEANVAYVLSSGSVSRLRYTIRDATGRVVLGARAGRACPAWNGRWRGCAVLDLSGLRLPGRYRIGVGRASAALELLPRGALYAPLAANATGFLQAQRDGSAVLPGPLGRRPAHLNDVAARVYLAPRYRNGSLAGPLQPTGRTVDVAGGWFDAGDYLKFSGTASFTDVLLLLTARDLGGRLAFTPALETEARVGTDWLLKTWDPRRRILLEQVGLGDGTASGSVLGDHDVWRLPQRDDGARGAAARYLAHRPVFAAGPAGGAISPNLAGREAAAFALCAQVFRVSDPAYAHRCLYAGQTLYDAAARRWRGRLAGSVPGSYYPETEWRDDMELAATELYLATLDIRTVDLPHREPYPYLEAASQWANQYQSSPQAGTDTLDLYDVAPLADYDLYRAMVASGNTTDLYTNAADVRADLAGDLSLGTRLSRSDPFGLADPAAPADTVGHALGEAVEARLFAAIGGGRRYEPLATAQLGWTLGENPWGSSFVVGAGSVFPHCLAHQVANLTGSLTGRGALLTGAVVGGPVGSRLLDAVGAPDGYRRCSATRAFAGFDGHGLRYLDDVRSPSTSEPSDDLAALSLLAFAQEAAGLPPAPHLTIPR